MGEVGGLSEAEWQAAVRVVGESIEDAALTYLGRDLGTIHRDDIAEAAIDALLPILAARAAAPDALREAWDKGYASGFSNAMRRMSDEPNAPTSPNPYRAALAERAGT